MEDTVNILELLLRPAFCVRDGRITQVNRDASRYLLAAGMPIRELIAVGAEEYCAFTSGRLFLTLQIGEQSLAASVIAQECGHIFILEQDALDAHLQSMALAAQELRNPLTGIMTAADRLLPMVAGQEDPAAHKYATQMNRRMFQLLRIVSNMSDAARFASRQVPTAEYVDISALFEEIFQCAQPLAQCSGHRLKFTGIQERIYSLADQELLERAVYNLISNAMKFSPAGSEIEAKLVHRGNQIRFTIEDPGCGIDTGIRSSVFSRYMRAPALEDPIHGLGLGLVMVQLAAAAHGGTVLIDQPHEAGTRVTMTLSIQQNKSTRVRTPVFHIDYAGERNHALIELSDVLDASLYEPQNIN